MLTISNNQYNCNIVENDDFPPIWNGTPFTHGGLASGLRYYMSDSTGLAHRDSALALLTLMATPLADVMRADMLLEMGNVSAATAVYNSIVDHYGLEGNWAAEYNTYGKALLNIRIALRNEGKNDRQLSPAQVTTLEHIATQAQSWARTRAQAWLQLYDGRIYGNTILLPDDGSGINERRKNFLIEEKNNTSNIFPNPVHDFVTINWSGEETLYAFQLIDVFGKTVLSQELKGNEGQQQVNIISLSNGIYFYKLIAGNRVLHSGKLVKQ